MTNKTVCYCECGCKNKIINPDNKGRYRKYIYGHSLKNIKRQSGSERYNWNGGCIKTPAGYVLIKQPDHPRANNNGYVREHILVLEKKIGRYLNKGEVTHHINGIKDDNRPENLELKTDHEHRSKHRIERSVIFKKEVVSKRTCHICNSSETYFDKKRKYYFWFKDNFKWLCLHCYNKLKYNERKNK